MSVDPIFDWDEHSVGHMWRRHAVTAREAEEAVLDPNAVTAEIGVYDDEYREAVVGLTNRGRLLFVVITERNDRLRVITARNATRAEGKAYFRR